MDPSAPSTTTTTTTSVVVSTPITPADPSEVKPAWYWIRDSKGYGSVTVTMIFVAFWVTTLAYILSMFDKVGPVSIRPFDVSACGVYFTPILTLYFGRKFTDAKFNVPTTPPTPTMPGAPQ